MKCINCGTDNKLKDRTDNQGRCVKCNHVFAFEPTSMGSVKITDPFFAKAIADISANNTLFFTPKQLLYFLDNRLRKSPKSFLGFSWLFPFFFINLITSLTIFIPLIVNLGFIIFFYESSKSNKLNSASRKHHARNLQIIGGIILPIGILLSLVSNSFLLFFIAVIMGMLPIYLGTRQLGRIGLLTQEFLFPESQVKDWLGRWQQINGSILKILPFPLPREENTPATVNPDVTAYSFDRLVVCDTAAIAQLLIANNFHFENNCAILSITGYPQSIFDTTMQMLRRNADLKVYAIHDCNPQGISLVHNLKTNANWFLNSEIAIIDIGLTPRQIIATKRGMFIQSSPESAQEAKQLPQEVRQSLSAEELAWLESGKFVELESFTPQRLIQVLQKGIAGSRNLEGDDSNLLLIGDTGSDMYVVQSFG
ncbi:MAG: hypothetical protein V7K98_06105 [Nostoc sp.]|uniref:hypothetical protein n=1 Tax=Nostoc sp. TaxID=1180 RepID=UPI002FF75865